MRPDDAPSDWKPSDTWNPLDDKTMPYSTHAKIICDVAASFSSNSHPFFSQMAQIAMEYAMRGLDVADHYVTLTQVYNCLLYTSNSFPSMTTGLVESCVTTAMMRLPVFRSSMLPSLRTRVRAHSFSSTLSVARTASLWACSSRPSVSYTHLRA